MSNNQKWQRELRVFNNVKTTFLLENNIHDIYEENGEFYDLDEYINNMLVEEGYERILFYDPINGFYNRFSINECVYDYLNDCGCCIRDEFKIEKDYYGHCYNPRSIESASEIVHSALTSNKLITIVMSFSSRYCSNPERMSEKERVVFMNLMLATLNARTLYVNNELKKNLLYLITDKTNDLPAWFYLNNPNQKIITIPFPNKDMRELCVNRYKSDFVGFDSEDEATQNKFVEDLVMLTDGMKCVDFKGIKNLFNKEKIKIQEIKKAVTLYKYGIKDNPWENIQRERLIDAENIISNSVKGQDVAVNKAVDIIKRAAVGLSGLQHSSGNAKPRGIMFFAGPTGTGKTELAKSITQLLFDNKDAYIRFDMSEYGQEHSDQRLLGAPPGYTGYEEGGQLTNAVREKPFSILLFDEIEKAHPKIWDKFLQILEDGRMTDSKGQTIYFSETLIIFTSNIGILRKIGDQVEKIVSPDDSYDRIQQSVLSETEKYFTYQLQRPEILNRIGKNNIIVFDYIREKTANEIVDKQIEDITSSIFENKKIKVDLKMVKPRLLELAMENIESGGRGIGNIMEEYVLNPMGRYIFDHNVKANDELIVEQIVKNDKGIISLKMRNEYE